MQKTWRLKRVVQCAKCPWRVSTNPRDIPNGYCEEKHKKLAKTIADESGNLHGVFEPGVPVMACHEFHDTPCIGWLLNQIGPGNNIPLRLHVRRCENLMDAKVIGDQHQTFQDTFPK